MRQGQNSSESNTPSQLRKRFGRRTARSGTDLIGFVGFVGLGRVVLAVACAVSLQALTAPSVHAEEPKGCAAGVAEATAQLVQARYDGIRDLRAKFVQTSQSATFAGAPLMAGDAKRGDVVFAKPGKMRWTYAEPEPSVVVSDGSTLWIHDVEGGTATRLEVTAGYLSGAALQFLLGDGQILEEFEVAATVCDEKQISLDLVPREDASYERLGLVADARTGDIQETLVVDLFGNRTEIRFESVEVNQKPAAAVFEFDVPEGVELIDYAATPAG